MFISMCIHIIGRECTKSMSRAKSKRTHATSRCIFGPAMPDRQPHVPSTSGPDSFTSRFCFKIHSQPLTAQRLNPTSSQSERTQCSSQLPHPGIAPPTTFFQFLSRAKFRPQPFAEQHLNPPHPAANEPNFSPPSPASTPPRESAGPPKCFTIGLALRLQSFRGI